MDLRVSALSSASLQRERDSGENLATLQKRSDSASRLSSADHTLDLLLRHNLSRLICQQFKIVFRNCFEQPKSNWADNKN
jgi:hypothetical protein